MTSTLGTIIEPHGIVLAPAGRPASTHAKQHGSALVPLQLIRSNSVRLYVDQYIMAVTQLEMIVTGIKR